MSRRADFIERLDRSESDGWIVICLVILAILWVSVILAVLLAPA